MRLGLALPLVGGLSMIVLLFVLSFIRHTTSLQLGPAAVPVALPSAVFNQLPPDFDWHTYRLMNPDIFELTQRQAELHYMAYGRHHGERYQRIPTYLSYDAIWGLCNQMYDHIHMMATALYMNATLVTPRVQSQAVVTRSADGNAAKPRFGEYRWEAVEGTLDWENMTAYWAERGLQIVENPGPSQCVVGNIWEKVGGRPFYSVPEAALVLTAYAKELAQPRLEANASAPVCVLLKHSNPLWFINGLRSINQTEPVLRGLFFSPIVLQKAAEIRDGLAAKGVQSYAAVHLRVEGDWFGNKGLEAYVRAMKEAQLNSSTVCYFASGIFDHRSDSEIAAVKDVFLKEGVCGSIYHKEHLLPTDAFDGLHSEQRALVNFLVLSRAEKLIGDSSSTFSKLCREYRALNGISKRTFFSVERSYRLGAGFEYYVADEVHPAAPPPCPHPEKLIGLKPSYNPNVSPCIVPVR